MGRIRVAKDGHPYQFRRTRSGRFYTVQHSAPSMRSFLLALLLGPWTWFLVLLLVNSLGWPLTLSLWAVLIVAACFCK